MSRPWKTRLRPVLLLTLLLLTAACEAEPRRYDFAIQLNGGPMGWPIWVEELTFDLEASTSGLPWGKLQLYPAPCRAEFPIMR